MYQANGVEPIAWKLDPSLKAVALSTGWLPFAAAPHAEDDAVTCSFDGKGNTGVGPAEGMAPTGELL